MYLILKQRCRWWPTFEFSDSITRPVHSHFQSTKTTSQWANQSSLKIN